MRINECFTSINHNKVKDLTKRIRGKITTKPSGATTLTHPTWGDLSSFVNQQDS